MSRSSGLEVRGISVAFAGNPPVAALAGVDLCVGEGSLVAVLGPSGCGKTTLLRVIAGLERPGVGTVEIDGRLLDDDGTHVPPERRGIGLVPQEGALFPHLDVEGNIAFGLRHLDRASRGRRVAEMLDLVSLSGLGARRPDELSGGQQQRVALARALAPGPSMLLLDEPFSALDSGLRAEVRAEVTGLLRATSTTALIVTHDQSEALEMADAVAVMRSGRIVQTGPPAELYHRPADVWVGQFLGDALVLPGTVVGGAVTCALGSLDLADGAPDGATQVFLRPEQLTLVPERVRRPGGMTTACPSASATVVEIRFRGHEAAVALDVAGTMVVARQTSVDLPAVGDVVGIEVTGGVLALGPGEV